MVNYECKICDFISKNKRNYIQHNNTNKHNKKVLQYMDTNISTNDNSQNSSKLPETPTESAHKNSMDTYKCKSCGNIFTRISNLTRHYKICTDKNEEIETLKLKVEQYEKDRKQYKKDVTFHVKETNHYKEEVEYYKQLLREAGGLVKKSVNALTYAVDNYDNAPPIKSITINEIDTFDKNTDKIVNDILSAYKHKTIGKYLGDIIIKVYKKDDPKTQSIWNTDDSRLTYLIKELLGNKSSNWVIDKKGIKTTEYLIEPLLSHIRSLLVSHQMSSQIPEINVGSVEIEFILENGKKLVNLINDIDDGVIEKEVLKHISGHLRFSNKLIE